MAIVAFESIAFHEQADDVLLVFLKNYRATIAKDDLAGIGKFLIRKNSIEFDVPEKRALARFNILLSRAFDGLIGPNGRPTTYIHQNSGIPLIGTNDFGIVDRDTDTIEVKPLTGCNLNCTFCSVDEGPHGRKVRDFLVEKDYLVAEFDKLAGMKKGRVEAHIAGQNEPTIYPELVGLVDDLSRLPRVRETAIDTNGTRLDNDLIERLKNAGLSRIDLSIHALDPQLAQRLAGTSYDVRHVIDMARLIAKSGIRLLIAPVLLPGVNEAEIEKIILLSKELGCLIGIQNFYAYERGRKPVKELPMVEFEGLLAGWERKHRVDLHLKRVFDIRKDKVLEKPFHKGDRVKVTVFSMGRYPGEVLGFAKGRTVTVFSQDKARKGEKISVKIIREKHNIFTALPSGQSP